MPEKHELHRSVDALPDAEVAATLGFLEFLLSQEAPVDRELLARIDAERANPSPGIPHEKILREYGL